MLDSQRVGLVEPFTSGPLGELLLGLFVTEMFYDPELAIWLGVQTKKPFVGMKSHERLTMGG